MNELVTKEKTDLVVPDDYFDEVQDTLDDNFTADDFVIPRIKLLQGQSDEVLAGEASPKHFWHTGMDADLGESFDFIIAARNKRRALIAPKDDGQGLLAEARDFVTWDKLGSWDVMVQSKPKRMATWCIDDYSVEATGLQKWGTYDPEDPESPPAAQTFYDYLVILPGLLDLGPAVMSLTKSAIKKAKKGLNDKIPVVTSKRPLSRVVWTATWCPDSNGTHDYYNWDFGMRKGHHEDWNKPDGSPVPLSWARPEEAEVAEGYKGLLQTHQVETDGGETAKPSADDEIPF